MQTDDPVRWAVVGLGLGLTRARLATQTRGATLAAVCDTNAELAREVGTELSCRHYAKLEDLLRDDEVEVVFVATPSGMHMDHCIAAMQAGKHTVSTKPMDVSVAKCRSAVAQAEASGRILAVDFQMRYEDKHLLVHKAIHDGLFGKVVLGEARLKWFRTQEYYDNSDWRGTWKMDGGGALANQTVHFIDLLLWNLGSPRRVWARCSTMTHRIETEDLGMVMVEFSDGAMGTVLGTTTFPTAGQYDVLEIHGENGGVIVRGHADPHPPQWLPGAEALQPPNRHGYPHHNIVEDVTAAVRSGTQPMCDGSDGLKTVAFLEAVYRSTREDGRPVEVEL